MKRKILLSILGLFLVFGFAGNIWADDDSRYPIMRADQETWSNWMKDHKTASNAQIDEGIKSMLYQAQSLDFSTSMDLLVHIDYDPSQRNQGSCGNCWAWASTGLMEIAHDVDDGVFDRLSVQYINSCRAPGDGCCANNIGTFATWYNTMGFAVPWDNTNALFADGANCCRDASNNPCPSATPCGNISTTPNYPITSISESRIATTSFWDSVNQATAIANIKAALNDNKGVYFGFALPNSAAWDDFFDFWDGLGVPTGDDVEETLWDHPDDYCGSNWTTNGGGHAVVILGYNDDDDDPANHYWLALNSWGTAGGDRPNDLFRIPTQMNYSCTYPNPGSDSIAAFVFYILDVEFGNSPPIADANGPYNADCQGTTTTVNLDGSGSSDPEDTALTYAWSTDDCPGGIFIDSTIATPVLTVDTSPGCYVTCSVTLTVTDGDDATDTDTATVTISDNTPPDLTCPANKTIECDESTEPSNTGSATASDDCDPLPVITYSDVEAPGSCPAEKTITRTWTATDACGNSSSCVQTINVEDTTAPVIACNAPATITPPDAPISFTATATDNCDNEPSVEITGFDCFKYTKKGKRIDKTMSCVVEVNGDTITIVDSGGVNDNITWTVSANDNCGNVAESTCSVNVVSQGKP